MFYGKHGILPKRNMLFPCLDSTIAILTAYYCYPILGYIIIPIFDCSTLNTWLADNPTKHHTGCEPMQFVWYLVYLGYCLIHAQSETIFRYSTLIWVKLFFCPSFCQFDSSMPMVDDSIANGIFHIGLEWSII